MSNKYRNYSKEQEIIDLIKKYRTVSITVMTETMGFSRKFYYNLIDSSVIPNRDYILTFIKHMNFSVEDAVILMALEGYIFPFNEADEEFAASLKRSPNERDNRSHVGEKSSSIAS